jgi:maltose O-acetyltransferase
MSPFVTARMRRVFLRLWGARLANGVSISPGCYFGGSQISIGQQTRLNRGVYIDNNAAVRIGARCRLAMQSMIITSTHESVRLTVDLAWSDRRE